MSHNYFGGKGRPASASGFGHVGHKAPLVFGVFSCIMAYLSYSLISSTYAPREQPSAAVTIERLGDPVELIDVLVADKVIQTGTALDPQRFRIERRSPISLSSTVVRSYEEIQGKFARTMIVPDQPLSREFLTSVRPSNSVIENIPAGFRAVTIRVDSRTSVEGWAQGGARVDVVWVSSIRGKPGIAVIVENAKVLSAERQVTQNADSLSPIPTTVTLLTNTDDAKRLQLASVSGALSLSLRGDGDVKSSPGVPITVDDLIKEARPLNQPEARAMLRIRGSNGKAETFNFQDGELVPGSRE